MSYPLDVTRVATRARQSLPAGVATLTDAFAEQAITDALADGTGELVHPVEFHVATDGTRTALTDLTVEQASDALHETLAAVVTRAAALAQVATLARVYSAQVSAAQDREAALLRRARRLGDRAALMAAVPGSESPEAAATALGYRTVEAALAAGPGAWSVSAS